MVDEPPTLSRIFHSTQTRQRHQLAAGSRAIGVETTRFVSLGGPGKTVFVHPRAKLDSDYSGLRVGLPKFSFWILPNACLISLTSRTNKIIAFHCDNGGSVGSEDGIQGLEVAKCMKVRCMKVRCGQNSTFHFHPFK
jgi:hypothetical protein